MNSRFNIHCELFGEVGEKTKERMPFLSGSVRPRSDFLTPAAAMRVFTEHAARLEARRSEADMIEMQHLTQAVRMAAIDVAAECLLLVYSIDDVFLYD